MSIYDVQFKIMSCLASISNVKWNRRFFCSEWVFKIRQLTQAVDSQSLNDGLQISQDKILKLKLYDKFMYAQYCKVLRL